MAARPCPRIEVAVSLRAVPRPSGRSVAAAVLTAVLVLFWAGCSGGNRTDGRLLKAQEIAYGKSKVACKIDYHVHYSALAFERAVRIMDTNGISVAVNLTPGFPGAGLDGAMIMSHLTGDRVVNFVTVDWDYVDDHERFAAENIRLMNRAKALGARGLKISKELGLGVTLENEELLRADDPRLAPIWKEAGRLGFPVSVHIADPVAFFNPPTPDNERYKELSIHPHWSFFGPQYPGFEDLISQFENIVASNPGTVFVGVHMGNYAENPEFVGRMLDKYPNYHVDVAARLPEFGRHNAARMRDFFIKYQDRILFGTDLGVGASALMLGSSDGLPKDEADAEKFFDAHWRYFETADRRIDTPTPIQGDWKIDGINLPTPVLEKLYHANAEKLLGMKVCR